MYRLCVSPFFSYVVSQSVISTLEIIYIFNVMCLVFLVKRDNSVSLMLSGMCGSLVSRENLEQLHDIN